MRPLPRRWHARRNSNDSNDRNDTHPPPPPSSTRTSPASTTHAPATAGRGQLKLATRIPQPLATLKQLQSLWLMTLLNEQKTGLSPLHQALIDQDHTLAEALLDADASVRAIVRPPIAPARSSCALLFALANPDAFLRRHGALAGQLRNECVVELVLRTDAAAPGRKLDRSGAHALTLAVRCNSPDALLIRLCTVGSRQYADMPNLEDAGAHTPLSAAITEGKLERVELLLLLGVDPDRRTGWGKPPLQLAIEAGRDDIFSSLLASGANPAVPAGSGSLLDLCVQHGRLDLLILCERHAARHRVAVGKCLLAQGKARLGGGQAEFAAFIQWARPLLTDKRLAKLAVAAARIAGNTDKLALLLAECTGPFPSQQLLPLRMAARASGDPAIRTLIARRQSSASE